MNILICVIIYERYCTFPNNNNPCYDVIRMGKLEPDQLLFSVNKHFYVRLRLLISF